LHKTTAFDIDHVTPLADGGEDVPENMQLLCSGCHAHGIDGALVLQIPKQAPGIGRMTL
jgi:5-methylcytosine-specific restriction endonuclease McrA